MLPAPFPDLQVVQSVLEEEAAGSSLALLCGLPWLPYIEVLISSQQAP